MGKNKSESGKPAKAKAEKKYTRAQAERALSNGADPAQFANHGNYHVRAKAWVKMGKPLPSDPAEQEKFLKGIHKWVPPVAEAPASPTE